MMDDVPPVVAPVEVIMPRLPPAASDAAFSVMVLDQSDTEGRARIDQAISQAPGASLFRRNASAPANPTTQGISLRSIAPSGAGRALVTVDGVPQNDPFGGWVIWAGLPPELYDRIDIVRGGGAGPYGAGALTGVIDLVERARPGLDVDVRGGNFDTRREAAVGETEIGGVDVLLGGSTGLTDGYIPVREHRGPVDLPLSERDWNLTGRLTTAVGDSRVSLHLTGFDEHHGSGLRGANARAEGQAASLTFGRGPSSTNLGYRLQAWVRTSNLENTSVAVAANRLTTTPANNQYKTPATGYGLNGAIRGGDSNYEWEVGADGRIADGDEHELFRFMNGTFTRNRVAGGRTTVAGFYGEATHKSGAWLFTGGARLDHWSSTDAHRLETDTGTHATTFSENAPDRDGWLPTGRIGARYAISGNLYWRSAGYVGFRPPTLNELYRPFRVGNDITEANSALEPERLYGAETAIGWQGENTSASATLFYNQLDDAVTNVTIGSGPGVIAGFPGAGFIPAGGTLRQRQNAGTIKATGVEADASHKYSDRLELRLAAAYTHAEVDGGTAAPQLTGLEPAQAPKFTGTATVTWKPIEPLRFDLRGRYETRRFEDDINSRRLGPAATLDVRAGWSLSKEVELYAAIDNATNTAVQTGQTADGVFSYGQPRTTSIGINIRR
ncbi:MAG TPA: TonB-dependent receptor [Caulobacteraceae bacterium]|nr:TonB-dependent receptor [Caulobacteraceae bacterium]